MLYLAIDQHSKQLTVNLRDEEGHVLLKRQVSTRWEKVRPYLDEVRRRATSHGGFVAILEVCGFNDWLLKLLAEYECREIVLIQPTKAQASKTDRRDAQQLGELLWVNRTRLLAGERIFGIKRVRIPDVDEQRDRQLTAMRLRVTRMRTKTINRARQILRRHNLQHDQPTKGFQTQATRKWLTGLQLSPLDRLTMDHLLAVMRRLTTIIWHMVTHQEPYKIGEPVARCKGKARPGDASGNDLQAHRETLRQEVSGLKT